LNAHLQQSQRGRRYDTNKMVAVLNSSSETQSVDQGLLVLAEAVDELLQDELDDTHSSSGSSSDKGCE
jgi:hypothetical protein